MGCGCQGSSRVFQPPTGQSAPAGNGAARTAADRRGLHVWSTTVPDQPPAQQKA
jgi:hypothetical protein